MEVKITLIKEEVKEIKNKHTETTYISLCIGEIMAKKFNPVISLSVMNVYSAWGPMDIILRTLGTAPITVSMTPFNFQSVRFNNAEIFKHNRAFERFINNRNAKPLSNDENIALDNFITNRRTGNDLLMRSGTIFKNQQLII